MAITCIRNGQLYDPANGIQGELTDIWLEQGRIREPIHNPDWRSIHSYDATGMVVMPGGIDMHCHIAGPKVTQARFMQPREQNGQPVVPHCLATGNLFAGMGYTTAVDAAIPGLSSRLAHHEFAITPNIDKAFLTLFGNNHYAMDAIRENDQEKLSNYAGWLLDSVQALGIKVVNPGGVENWKQISRKTIRELETPIPDFDVTPRQIVHALARSADQLELAHPVHVHCNNLGIPGNSETTLHTMQALEGHRGHFAHIQFHSYGKSENDKQPFKSGVDELVDYLISHPEITVDVGHITPGQVMTITGDAPFAEHLAELTNGKWYTADTEMEASCGVIPGEFKPFKSIVHAVQWAIGLEWYLKMPDPWRIAMSSDHPNGGAFSRYPEVIHLLMDRNYRIDFLERMPETLKENSDLAELDREYSLNEIAIITRAAPARILGLSQKGHLGVGADADVTIYSPQENITEMFQRPRYVFQHGEPIVEHGEIQRQEQGNLFYAPFEYDQGLTSNLKEWFNDNYSIRFGNYRISEGESPCQLAVVD